MIRDLQSGDAGQIAAIHARSFDKAWTETDLAAHIARDLCLGIGAGPLDGFTIYRIAGDQAEIVTIAISPEKRGAGLARDLLRHGENQLAARGITLLYLEVAEDNRAAIALYRKSGFEPIGKRPAYYRRNHGRVAALTFRKALDASRSTG